MGEITQQAVRAHTTHFDDCGCLSARKDAALAEARTALAVAQGEIQRLREEREKLLGAIRPFATIRLAKSHADGSVEFVGDGLQMKDFWTAQGVWNQQYRNGTLQPSPPTHPGTLPADCAQQQGEM